MQLDNKYILLDVFCVVSLSISTTRQIGMFVRANFVDIYSLGMRDRSMGNGTELANQAN